MTFNGLFLLQVLAPKEVLDEWQQRPTKLVCRYIKRLIIIYLNNVFINALYINIIFFSDFIFIIQHSKIYLVPITVHRSTINSLLYSRLLCDKLRLN